MDFANKTPTSGAKRVSGKYFVCAQLHSIHHKNTPKIPKFQIENSTCFRYLWGLKTRTMSQNQLTPDQKKSLNESLESIRKALPNVAQAIDSCKNGRCKNGRCKMPQVKMPHPQTKVVQIPNKNQINP